MRRLFLSFMLLVPLVVFGQTIKTGVLIIGNNNTAFAAGVQSVLSNVNTTVLTLEEGFKLENLEIQPLNGIFLELNKQRKKAFKTTNSTKLPSLSYQSANAVIKQWSDSSKIFKVINNTKYTEIKRAGKGWSVKLNDGKLIRAKALVWASNPDQLLKALKISALKTPLAKAFSYAEVNYRNSVLAITPQLKYYTLDGLLIAGQENLIYLEENSYALGQTAGAITAYAAFFDTKTSLSNLRMIQAELLKFKSPIIPLKDIPLNDSSWTAIQKTVNTGLLKAEIKDGYANFNPDKIVTLDEIKQPLKDYYYKANIWIEDNKSKPFNLEQAIALVSALGNKSPETTKNILEKGWNKTYKFKSNFDLKKEITRREFSILVADFLQVFEQSHVDKTGRIIR